MFRVGNCIHFYSFYTFVSRSHISYYQLGSSCHEWSSVPQSCALHTVTSRGFVALLKNQIVVHDVCLLRSHKKIEQL